MTYCLGIITDYGLVMAADSRTNAGVDHISTYQKLFDFSNPGERVILLCSAGNLSITQGIVSELEKDLKVQEETNLHNITSMYEVARYIGGKLRQVRESDEAWLKKDRIDTQCSLLLGGQIQGQSPELFLIYSQGNFIHATPDTPFLQIGETKYGKPILDRTLSYNTPLESAAKCALLSIDSTMKSNISVGPPINLVMYEKDNLAIRHRLRLRLGDPYIAKIRKLWEESLKQAFDCIPEINWQHREDDSPENIMLD
ncbi:MAG: proteasome-type protease [Cyanobacteriota bacterium]|nr:proteasome-type protease [Cyanobacteriota bacterium]